MSRACPSVYRSLILFLYSTANTASSILPNLSLPSDSLSWPGWSEYPNSCDKNSSHCQSHKTGWEKKSCQIESLRWRESATRYLVTYFGPIDLLRTNRCTRQGLTALYCTRSSGLSLSDRCWTDLESLGRNGRTEDYLDNNATITATDCSMMVVLVAQHWMRKKLPYCLTSTRIQFILHQCGNFWSTNS